MLRRRSLIALTVACLSVVAAAPATGAIIDPADLDPAELATEVGPSTTPKRTVDMPALVREFGPPPADAILPADGGPVPYHPDSDELGSGPLLANGPGPVALASYSRREVCAEDVWIRDTPAGWAHGIIYRGYHFDPDEYRPSWVHGNPLNSSGNGPGWAIRNAFCPL